MKVLYVFGFPTDFAATWVFKKTRRSLKNLEELGSIPIAKIIQEIQPNKTCVCGACEPKKAKRADGKRRLKVSPHLVVNQRAWVKEDSIYDYVPQIRLVG